MNVSPPLSTALLCPASICCPLVVFACCRSVAIALVSRGASVNRLLVPDRAKPPFMSPLRWAVQENSTDVCDLLLRNKADINVKDPSDNTTPLHWGVARRAAGTVELVLQLRWKRCWSRSGTASCGRRCRCDCFRRMVRNSSQVHR